MTDEKQPGDTGKPKKATFSRAGAKRKEGERPTLEELGAKLGGSPIIGPANEFPEANILRRRPKD